MNRLDDISIVPEPSETYLNQRQLVDYKSRRENCLEWLLAVGKTPEEADGYAFQTVKQRSHRMDQFYRWVWDQQDGYTVEVTHEDANDWLYHLARLEKSNAHKDNCRKAVQMLYKWHEYQLGYDEWEPALSFSSSNDTTTPRDYLTLDERSMVREDAL